VHANTDEVSNAVVINLLRQTILFSQTWWEQSDTAYKRDI